MNGSLRHCLNIQCLCVQRFHGMFGFGTGAKETINDIVMTTTLSAMEHFKDELERLNGL